MNCLSRFAKTSTFVAFLALTLGFASPAQARAQDDKPSNWRKILHGIGTALNAASPVVGAWQGGKTENNPFGGGYLNLTFRFNFLADGTYQEAAYTGSSQVMFAQGKYQFLGSSIVFLPDQCVFSSPELGSIVKLFPIPTDANTQQAVSYSPLAGGGQLSLKDTNSGEDWGLKPFRAF